MNRLPLFRLFFKQVNTCVVSKKTFCFTSCLKFKDKTLFLMPVMIQDYYTYLYVWADLFLNLPRMFFAASNF